MNYIFPLEMHVDWTKERLNFMILLAYSICRESFLNGLEHYWIIMILISSITIVAKLKTDKIMCWVILKEMLYYSLTSEEGSHNMIHVMRSRKLINDINQCQMMQYLIDTLRKRIVLSHIDLALLCFDRFDLNGENSSNSMW